MVRCPMPLFVSTASNVDCSSADLGMPEHLGKLAVVYPHRPLLGSGIEVVPCVRAVLPDSPECDPMTSRVQHVSILVVGAGEYTLTDGGVSGID